MSKIIFNKNQVDLLKKNKNIKNVSEKAITYTDEFKAIFVKEYNLGKSTRIIFEEAGLDIGILGKIRIKECSKRWRKQYNELGIIEDTRKGGSGRPLTRELSFEEKYKRLEAKNKLLEAENELLKKAKMIERGLIKDLFN